MNSRRNGPLGNLPGLEYDPERDRYFPIGSNPISLPPITTESVVQTCKTTSKYSLHEFQRLGEIGLKTSRNQHLNYKVSCLPSSVPSSEPPTPLPEPAFRAVCNSQHLFLQTRGRSMQEHTCILDWTAKEDRKWTVIPCKDQLSDIGIMGKFMYRSFQSLVNRTSRFEVVDVSLAFENSFSCPLVEYTTNSSILSCCLTRDSSKAVLGSMKGGFILDTATRQLHRFSKVKSHVLCVTTSPCSSGRIVYSGSRDGKIRLFDTRQRPTQFQVVATMPSSIHSMEIVQDQLLLTQSVDESLCLFDLRRNKRLSQLYKGSDHLFQISSSTYSPELGMFSFVSASHQLYIWDIHLPQPLFTSQPLPISTLSLSQTSLLYTTPSLLHTGNFAA